MQNVYMFNNRTFIHMRQKLIILIGKINKSTLMVEESNIYLSVINRTRSQKISKVI